MKILCSRDEIIRPFFANKQASATWQTISIYLFSLLIVFLGCQFSRYFLAARRHYWAQNQEAETSLNPLANWDGVWYQQIAANGYNYNAKQPSNVVFFPAYPLAGRFLATTTGLSYTASLLAISHLSLCGAYGLMFRYIHVRHSGLSKSVSPHLLLSLRFGQ